MIKVNGPDTKYMIFWAGDWRAVTNMLDHRNVPTTLAMRAAKAVFYLAEYNGYNACAVSPGDLVERLDRDPNAREWDYID